MVQYAGFYIEKNFQERFCGNLNGQHALVIQLFDPSWNKEKVFLKLLSNALSM